MPKQKTQQMIAKRIRVTKNKKVITRHCGQDHFNARATGKKIRNKRRDNTLSEAFKKTVLSLTNNA